MTFLSAPLSGDELETVAAQLGGAQVSLLGSILALLQTTLPKTDGIKAIRLVHGGTDPANKLLTRGAFGLYHL